MQDRPAGSIIRSGGSIHGITTGAAIWIAGSIGVACATGNLILAALVTVLALVIVCAGVLRKPRAGGRFGPVSSLVRRREAGTHTETNDTSGGTT